MLCLKHSSEVLWRLSGDGLLEGQVGADLKSQKSMVESMHLNFRGGHYGGSGLNTGDTESTVGVAGRRVE